MKFKSYSKPNDENNDFVIINDCRNLSNVSDSINTQKYIGKKDVLEIIDSIPLINEFNNEYNNNYIKIIGNEIDKLKKIEGLNDLDLLKSIKEEKIIFEIKLEEICEKGSETEEFNNVKNLLLNDNSNE